MRISIYLFHCIIQYRAIWGSKTMTAIHVINKTEHFILYIFHEILYVSLSFFHFMYVPAPLLMV